MNKQRMYGISLIGGKDPMPVMVRWDHVPTESELEPYRRQWRGYDIRIDILDCEVHR